MVRRTARATSLALFALLVTAALMPLAARADVAPVPGPPGENAAPSVYPPETPRTVLSDILDAGPTLAGVFLVPLALTLAIEIPVFAAFGKGARGRAALAGLFVNTLTNPVLVGLVASAPLWLPDMYAWDLRLTVLLLLELAVVAVEWPLLKWSLGWSNRRALAAAATANVLSFGVGLLLGFSAGVF